jgi:hypothetical protein
VYGLSPRAGVYTRNTSWLVVIVLLRRYAALFGSQLPTFLRSPLVPTFNGQQSTFWDKIWVAYSRIKYVFLKMGSIGCSKTPVTINQRCVTSLPKTLSYTAAVAWNHARLPLAVLLNYSILSNIRSTKYLSQHYFLQSSFDGRVVFEELSLWTRYLIRFQSIQIIYHDTNRDTLTRNAVSVFLNTPSI